MANRKTMARSNLHRELTRIAVGLVLLLPAEVYAQNSLALLPSTNPSAASPGGGNVTLTASGFPSGVIDPAALVVTLSATVPSSGPTVTTVATGIATVFGTERRVTFRVPATLTFSHPVTYAVSLQGQVSSGGAVFTSGNTSLLTVNPPPAILSVSPAYGLPGQTFSALLTGAFTDFTPAVTTADFGQGVTVAGLTVTSSTTATAQLQISPAAPLGANNVTLQTGVETATLNGAFQVSGPASVQSLSFVNGPQGSTFTLSVTGLNTHFSGASLATLSGTGITVNSFSAASATSLALNLTVAVNAPLGTRTLTLTTGVETVSASFTVTPPLPLISLSPTTGAQGNTVTVAITGVNTHFSSGSVVSLNGGGITPGVLTGVTATAITVALTIDVAAAVGARDVTVQTGAETVTAAAAFTVMPLIAPVTGLVTRVDGATPAAGALVRLYRGNPLTLAATQVTADNTGAFAFAGVPAGPFTIIALNPARTEVGTATGQVLSTQAVAANVRLSGVGNVTVNVSDSNGTAVPNANVSLSLTSFTVPADLSSAFTATAVADGSGAATFTNFFAGSLFAAAGDPVTNHGGTTTGIVAAGASVTLPLFFNINEVTAAIFSVQNGLVPGTVPNAGENQAPFWIYSVQNGSVPGSTMEAGTNQAPFWIFSVQNGSVPGSTMEAGTNEAPFWIYSLQNGTVPGSVIPDGFNEYVVPLFSVSNDATLAPAPHLTSAAKIPASGALAGRARVVLPAERVTAGQTIRIGAAPDQLLDGALVEFFINGESFGTYASPWSFALTAPYTVSSLRVTAVSEGGRSEEAVLEVAPETVLRLRGRIASGEGAPVQGKTVGLLYSGLRAELFHFTTPLREMPDLTGLPPAQVRAVSGLNLRNPGGVFGKDPLASGLAPDFVVRFTGALSIEQEGEYVFSLRGQEGVSLQVGGQLVPDGGKVRLQKGEAPLEAVVFAGGGAMDVQLLWQAPGGLLGPVPEDRLWTREPALRTTTDLGGQFAFDGISSSPGMVRVVAEDVASEAVPAATGELGVLRTRKKIQ